MRLIDAPKDVLLSVFYLLQIRDLLVLERTCSSLRNAVASRYLWLSLLQRLVYQACTPELLSYVDVDKLSYSEIRSLVIGTLRWIKSCSDSDLNQTSVSTRSQNTVLVETPRNAGRLSDNPKKIFHRLAPGGKLLFLADPGCLEVFDVHRSVCIWSHTPRNDDKDVKLMGFAFEGRSDSSFVIFIVSFDAEANSALFELFQLESGQGKDKALVHQIAQDTSQRGLDDSIGIRSVCMGGDFTAIFMVSSQTRSVIIWNWKTGELSDIILRSDADLYCLQIMRGHLFYVLSSKYMHWRSETFSLRQFEDSAPLVYLEDIKSCSFEINSLHFWLVDKPQIVLAFFQASQLSGYVADHFQYALEHSDTCIPYPSPIRHIRAVRPTLYSPYEFTAALAASLSGCVIHDADSVVQGDQMWRLPPNGPIRVLGFNDQGEFYRTPFDNWAETPGIVVEFGCGAIVQSILEGDPKRIVIHSFI